MGCDPDADCPSKKCSDYSSQTQAQKDFSENTAYLENLDPDKDGIPCENLPNT
ncbi:excalibur calcium-binding domain-containing protein [Leeuwenhoekiella sp. CH_XMU1409-2]|uniref:excalibur calcium-binding domain-containing protein n=1 Tax=Leeuwenhoekiella sp. CH_XMU1409-2 TaxID=3107768 RepID=UPI003FA5E2A0